MKVVNKTRYSTRTLRSLFTEAYRRLAKDEGPLPSWKWMTVTVNYSRNWGRVSGRASLRGGWVRMNLPKGSVDAMTLAKVVDHEFQHSYGYTHDKMVGGAKFHAGPYHETFSWARERFGEMLTESRDMPKLKPKKDLQAHRAALVDAGILRWEKKLKYAQSKLRSLRQRKRYYDRALAAKRTKEEVTTD
jgi:hypothetical protein